MVISIGLKELGVSLREPAFPFASTGITMTLGDPDDDYVVSVVVQICDMYGECATSNTITIQVQHFLFQCTFVACKCLRSRASTSESCS